MNRNSKFGYPRRAGVHNVELDSRGEVKPYSSVEEEDEAWRREFVTAGNIMIDNAQPLNITRADETSSASSSQHFH